MSNYRGRRPETKVLPEIPSDVAGLYAILDRTNEPGDPELERYRVEDEAGIDIPSRADSVVRLLDHRFKGFRRERLEVLMRVFYSLNDYCFYREEHFDRVLDRRPGLGQDTIAQAPRGATRSFVTRPWPRAGLDPLPYSAHSLRAGVVTYAHLRGASDRANPAKLGTAPWRPSGST